MLFPEEITHIKEFVMEGISVILTTYNGEIRGFLDQAIQSVLNQSYQIFELIIVDDGSTDKTEILCSKYLDSDFVKYLKKSNGGPASARNFGIKHSRYNYISFLDDDDLYEEHMLEKLLFFLKKQKYESLGMVYCAVQEMESKEIKFELHTGNIFNDLLKGNFLTTSAVLLHRKVFEEVGYFSEDLRYSEDYDLWLRISKKFQVAGLDCALVKRRVHNDQLSSHSEKMQVYHRFVLEKACEFPLLSLKKNEVLFPYYMTYAKIFLGQKKYKLFRKEFVSASQCGLVSFKWRIKYLLSFSPLLFNFFHRLVKRFE